MDSTLLKSDRRKNTIISSNARNTELEKSLHKLPNSKIIYKVG